METPILRRLDEASILQRMYPIYLQSCDAFYQLAMHFSQAEWKDRLILFWQRQLGCVTDLEEKIRSRGGNLQPILVESIPPEGSSHGNDLQSDVLLVARAIDLQTQALQLNQELQKLPHAVDIDMLLRRHALQGQDSLEKLQSIHTPPPPAALSGMAVSYSAA